MAARFVQPLVVWIAAVLALVLGTLSVAEVFSK
jgi:hypothetical protein